MNKKIKNPLFKGKNKMSARHFSAGGMLVGPSHDDGGIQAIVDGTEPIEVEGGEFIINKQTVDAVGEEFLHKLNSTETTHHTGGYNEGQLPSPSQFKDGGKVNRSKARINRVNRRTKPITTHRLLAKGGMVGGTVKNITSVNEVNQFQSGGVTGGLNKQCRMHVSSLDCKKTKGCTWNDSTGMCH